MAKAADPRPLPIGTIAERDVDILVLEELHVSPDFQVWLYEVCTGERRTDVHLVHAQQSVVHASAGESDLVAVYETTDGASALLIENKINAPPQPEQAARYRLRGERGQSAGEWARFWTVLLAPERYLGGSREAEVYDVQLSYEEIEEWFGARTDVRSLYRRDRIRDAIEQQRRGYTPVVDDRVTAFWRAYYELVCRHYRPLVMREPGRRAVGSIWIPFAREGLPPGCRIKHKIERREMALEIGGRVDELAEIEAQFSDVPGLRAMPAGKSTALVFTVPEIDATRSLESQREAVEEALRAAVRLHELAQRLKGEPD